MKSNEQSYIGEEEHRAFKSYHLFDYAHISE